MTAEEAIKELQQIQMNIEWEYPIDWSAAIDEAIKLIEKQIPKKPYIDKCKITGTPGWYCGACHVCSVTYKGSYCPRCGNAIDWSEVERCFA